MAFNADSVAVTDVAAAVFDAGANYQGFAYTKLVLKNTGSETAYVGGDGTELFPLEAGQSLAVAPVGKHDILYAVCGAGLSTTLVFLWTDPPA